MIHIHGVTLTINGKPCKGECPPKLNTIIHRPRKQQQKYQAGIATCKNMFYGVARRKTKIKANKSWRVKEQNKLVPIYRAATEKNIKTLRNGCARLIQYLEPSRKHEPSQILPYINRYSVIFIVKPAFHVQSVTIT